MSSKHLALTHAACFLVLAACGSSATQGETASATDGSSSGASSSSSGTNPTTGPTTGVSATGTSATEGSGSNSETNATSGTDTTEGITGTSVTTTGDTTTTTGNTTTTGDTTTTSDTSTTGDSSTTTTGDSTSTGPGSTTGDSTSTSSSTGDSSTGMGGSTTGEPLLCGDTLVATIRDFKLAHPDMEDYCCGQVDGLVQNVLGPNKKPLFLAPGNPKMLTDAPTFAQWYTDVPDVNQKTQIVLNLVEVQPGVYSYTNNSFFPVDNMLWGNEGNNHNFHFTTVHDTS